GFLGATVDARLVGAEEAEVLRQLAQPFNIRARGPPHERDPLRSLLDGGSQHVRRLAAVADVAAHPARVVGQIRALQAEALGLDLPDGTAFFLLGPAEFPEAEVEPALGFRGNRARTVGCGG